MSAATDMPMMLRPGTVGWEAARADRAERRIAELERIISKAGDALTTPYADDQERVENARRILEQG